MIKLFLIIMIFLLGSNHVECKPTDFKSIKEELKYTRNTYIANLPKSRPFRCKFTYAAYKGGSTEEAFQDKFGPPVTITYPWKGLWIREDEKIFYSIDCDDSIGKPTFDESSKKGFIQDFCGKHTYLSNGIYSVTTSPNAFVARFHKDGNGPQYSDADCQMNPIYLGYCKPYNIPFEEILKQAINGTLQVTFLETRMIRENEVRVFRFTDRDSKRLFDIGFDHQHGCWPGSIVGYYHPNSNSPSSESFVKEYLSVGDNHWIPKTTLVVKFKSDKPDTITYIIKYEVECMTFLDSIPKSDFEIELRERCQLQGDADSAIIKTPSILKVNPDNIEAIYENLHLTPPQLESELRSTTPPKSTSLRRAIMIGLAVLAVLSVVLIGFYRIRYLRRKAK